MYPRGQERESKMHPLDARARNHGRLERGHRCYHYVPTYAHTIETTNSVEAEIPGHNYLFAWRLCMYC